ncbi:tRNA (adenosine(37)-N6)-threonylcarbamoyltransferase complex ATPase subunit type 1 TsaE [bacterium]|nr:tRNA (adenosine(37)-N6)-threonylcarbamoyltransferase complex ATPase subunit type 1 TsaE [bacterium]
MLFEKITHTEDESLSLARFFSQYLKRGDVVALFGEMGAGKTVFIRGICEGLQVTQHVNSPTFVIINEYDGRIGGESILVRHFDFYRIRNEKDIAELGVDDFFNNDGCVCLIEWSERVKKHLPVHYWKVDLQKLNENDRHILVQKIES